MKPRVKLGILSLILGGVAVPCAATAVHFRSVIGSGSSFILDWFVSKGADFSDPNPVPVVSAPSLFTVTDERALTALVTLAIILSVAAMVVALVAEYRRERTLYLSAGYICGALAIMLLRPLHGLIAMVAGITIAMVMRHGRGTRDT